MHHMSMGIGAFESPDVEGPSRYLTHEDFFRGVLSVFFFHSHSKGLYNDTNDCVNHSK